MRVATRIVENGSLCCTYEGLLCSAMAGFRIEQHRLAPTALVISVPAPADYPEFAADWKIPDIQAENFAAPVRAAELQKAVAKIAPKPGGTAAAIAGFVEAIR
jgi:hypothetical protein